MRNVSRYGSISLRSITAHLRISRVCRTSELATDIVFGITDIRKLIKSLKMRCITVTGFSFLLHELRPFVTCLLTGLETLG